MVLPARDAELVQIMDAALADAAQKAGSWLACRPGCTQCCHGAFAINGLDVARLQAGMRDLQEHDPQKFKHVAQRARSWIAQFESEFPGNAAAAPSSAAQLIANAGGERPDVPRIELAARLMMAGRATSPEFASMRENAARELAGRPDGVGVVFHLFDADQRRQAPSPPAPGKDLPQPRRGVP